MTPYEDISFTIVVWNDEKRLAELLAHVRPWFKTIGVCVQESPDYTLWVAQKFADVVVEDKHHGFGDASYGPKLLTSVESLAKWTLRVDADEWPTEQLLENLGALVQKAEAERLRGVWVPFRSWVDDFEWEEDHSHLRLFHANLPWPPTLHSRPMIEDTLRGLKAEEWGCLEHKRSLDEMVQDYLSYYKVGRGNRQWEEHNRAMMRAACEGAADRHGWDYVTAFSWWPDVVDAAYQGQSPIKQKEAQMPPETKTVYSAGISSSGTRLLFDIIRKLGFTPQHASVPGYRFGEIENAVDSPVWLDREWMESRYGPGRWIIIRRDPWAAAHSALRRGFIKQLSDYAEYADHANELIKTMEDGALEISYEELVADPKAKVSEIARWLGTSMPSGIAGLQVEDADAKYPEKPDDWEAQLGWVQKEEEFDATYGTDGPQDPEGAHEFTSDRSGKRCLVCGKTPRAKVHQS